MLCASKCLFGTIPSEYLHTPHFPLPISSRSPLFAVNKHFLLPLPGPKWYYGKTLGRGSRYTKLSLVWVRESSVIWNGKVPRSNDYFGIFHLPRKCSNFGMIMMVRFSKCCVSTNFAQLCVCLRRMWPLCMLVHDPQAKYEFRACIVALKF